MNENELEERLRKNINRKSTRDFHTNKERFTETAKKLKETIENTEQIKNDNSYEMVNHPQHYNNYDIEVIDMMERIWGTDATILFCKMNAYKYRMRMGTKPGENDSYKAMKNKLLEDFNKEQWYLKKAKELSSVNKCSSSISKVNN